MCGIIITNNIENIKMHLASQEDRGLDSVGVVNQECIYKSVKKDIKGYEKYISSIDNTKGIHLLHHRKATVGDVNISNTHPFVGEKFILMQNGTVKDFHKETEFNKDVDSHNLLMYIEKHTDDIKVIPSIIKQFKEAYKEEIGILIICDYIGNIMFISDGARESYIEIEEGKISLIKNYRPFIKEGYKNIGHILFTFSGEILESSFEGEINGEDFKKKVVYYPYLLEEETPIIKKKKGKRNEEKEDTDKYNHLQLEIVNYLWANLEHLHYYNEATILTDFLDENYGVTDVSQFYFTYKEGFPRKFFTEKFNEMLHL